MADEQKDKVTIWGDMQMKYFKSGKSVFSNWIIGIALILVFCACSKEKNGQHSEYKDTYTDYRDDNSNDEEDESSQDNNSEGKDESDDGDANEVDNGRGTEKSNNGDTSDEGNTNVVDTDIGKANPEIGDTSDVGDIDVENNGVSTEENDKGDNIDSNNMDTNAGTGTDNETDMNESDTDTSKFPIDLVDCEASEEFVDADCGTYTTFHGTTVQQGPYGAHMDTNVGRGFETEVALGDQTSILCSTFVTSFNASEEESERILDTGDLDFALYSVYRPAMFIEGETYPLITWGNGTCAMPEGYGTLLYSVTSPPMALSSSLLTRAGWVATKRCVSRSISCSLPTKIPKAPTTKRSTLKRSAPWAIHRVVAPRETQQPPIHVSRPLFSLTAAKQMQSRS